MAKFRALQDSSSVVGYDVPGCKPEYPTKVCTFNGGHTNVNGNPGTQENWIAKESWNFFRPF